MYAAISPASGAVRATARLISDPVSQPLQLKHIDDGQYTVTSKATGKSALLKVPLNLAMLALTAALLCSQDGELSFDVLEDPAGNKVNDCHGPSTLRHIVLLL